MRLAIALLALATFLACSSSRLQTAATPAGPSEAGSSDGEEDVAKDDDQDGILFGDERTKETTIAILPPEEDAGTGNDDNGGGEDTADATDDGTDDTAADDTAVDDTTDDLTDDTADDIVDDAPPPPPPPPPLNDTNKATRDFARNNLNNQVGNGLCQALQDGALAAASANQGALSATLSSASFDLRGLRLIQDDKVLPGDLLHWAGGTNYNNFPASGNAADFEPINPAHLAFVAVDLGHVAIVDTVQTVEFDGRDVVEVEILHQNINNVKLVKRHTIFLDPEMISVGSIKVYRPAAN